MEKRGAASACALARPSDMKIQSWCLLWFRALSFTAASLYAVTFPG